MIIRYNHHGTEVSVDALLKGKHREHCLCYMCEKFNPKNRNINCPIANDVFENCASYNIVTPVWECPSFAQKKC